MEIDRTGDQVSWVHQRGDRYLATGTTPRGKRVRILSQQWAYISAINLWNGTKWLIRDGKRHRIQTVTN